MPQITPDEVLETNTKILPVVGKTTKTPITRPQKLPTHAILPDPQGGSMIPGNGVQFYAQTFSTPFTWSLQSPYGIDGSNPTQTITLRVDQTVYVYHEVANGVDDFYVVYIEDGAYSPNTNQQGPVDNTGLARGLMLGMFTTKVFPSLDPNAQSPALDRVSWVSSSPITVNQQTTQQNMVVTSTSTSISAAVGESPSIGVSASEGVQLWNSQTYQISDWGVLEETDAANNTPGWTYYQQNFFDATSTQPFKEWCNNVYDDNGQVKMPPNLSRSTLQYQTNAAWRFQKSLLNSSGTLPVTFKSNFSLQLYELGSRFALGGSGHYQLHRWNGGWEWTIGPIDLAQILAGPQSS